MLLATVVLSFSLAVYGSGTAEAVTINTVLRKGKLFDFDSAIWTKVIGAWSHNDRVDVKHCRAGEEVDPNIRVRLFKRKNGKPSGHRDGGAQLGDWQVGDEIVPPGQDCPPEPESEPCVPPANLNKIICPVMAALVKNCDLVPDAQGFVTKEQTRRAMRRVGISREAAKGTANANFNHLKSKRLNLFAMNTIKSATGGNSRTEAVEHFRSTGIRDRDQPHTGALNAFLTRLPKAEPGKFTLLDTLKAASLWDIERPHAAQGTNHPFPSNDVNVDLRPDGCTPDRSVQISLKPDGTPDMAKITADTCFSALHGAIGTMHQEFGTPQGEAAILTQGEMRALWLSGE